MSPWDGRVGHIITLVGPTAVGKSSLALDLASRLDAEIINADSMQGYIGMDIGTAKPTIDDRIRVRHHCVDAWTVDTEISVVEFRDAARSAIISLLAVCAGHRR